MPLSEVTAPTYEPLGLQEVKDHLRVTHSDQDALISELIPAARRFAEGYTRRALITQTWDLLLDRFPKLIELPRPPLQSVTSIAYVDATGTSQTLDAANYQIDAVSAPARVAPSYGNIWPQTYAEMNVVTVRYVAGYGDAGGDVPAGIRQAMLMLIGHLYENPEATISGTIIARVPMGVEYLLDPYRVMKAVV